MGAALLAATLLGGCAALGPSQPTPPSDNATTPVSPDPTPADAKPFLTPPSVPDGIVAATGSFDGEYGITGDVRILRSGDGWLLEFEHLAGPLERTSVFAIARGALDADGCPADFNWNAGIGGNLAVGSPQLPLPPVDTFEDPTYLSEIGISVAGEQQCGNYGFARAPLTWTLPDLRPDLEPIDSGERDGARGTTTDGVYLVASGDTETGILDRFGLSFGDLVYLNPTADHVLRNDFPWADCTINVSKYTRPRVTVCH